MQETLSIGLVVVAVVGALKDLLGKQITGNVTRVVAMAIGGALGYFHVLATDVVAGALAGLVAVGTVTIAEKVGEKVNK